MDFSLSAEDEAFRQEVREFVRKEWRPTLSDLECMGGDLDIPEVKAQITEIERKLVAKRWWAMHWPKEHGGQDAPFGRYFAYREEMGYAGAPIGPAANIAGPIMIHGSDWMKQYFLPRMAKAQIRWAQGFSEPNAGTDLANLQTRAVEDGDDLVVTGQKIWSSGSHNADWYHVLVRTDPNAPKHRGITYLAMQLKDANGNLMPGITLRPLYDFTGVRRWNEVFMDGVRVPKRNMIGEMNRGWYAAMTTLNFERTRVDLPARHIGVFDRFVDLCRETKFGGRSILEDPQAQWRLADLRILLEADRMLCYRVAWMEAAGKVTQAEGMISGYRLIHTQKWHLWPTLAQILGPYAGLRTGEERAPGKGVYGTSNVVSMNDPGGGGGILLAPGLIATRGLGLPR